MVEKKTVKKYNASPGYTLVGYPEFPIETDDPELQKTIESTKAFQKRSQIWIVDTKNDAEIEGALSGLSFKTMRKMAYMAGHRNVDKYTKVELLDVLEKEGF
jgi:hypothetical protein